MRAMTGVTSNGQFDKHFSFCCEESKAQLEDDPAFACNVYGTFYVVYLFFYGSTHRVQFTKDENLDGNIFSCTCNSAIYRWYDILIRSESEF